MAPRLALHHFRRDFRMQSTLRAHRLIDFCGPYCVCALSLQQPLTFFRPVQAKHTHSVSQRRNNIQINN